MRNWLIVLGILAVVSLASAGLIEWRAAQTVSDARGATADEAVGRAVEGLRAVRLVSWGLATYLAGLWLWAFSKYRKRRAKGKPSEGRQ